MNVRLSLKAKLIALCLFINSVAVIVGLISFLGLKDVAQSYEQVANVALPNLASADQMYLSYRKVRIELRTLGLPGLSKEQADKSVAGVREAIEEYEVANEKYASLPFAPGEEELYKKVDEAWHAFKNTGGVALKLYASGTQEDRAKLMEIFLVECPAKAEVYGKQMDALQKFIHHNSETWVGEARSETDTTNKIILWVIILGSIGGLACGSWFAVKLSKSIANITKTLADGADQVNQASTQIATSAQILSQSSTQQASSLEETVATMEELTAMVKLNTDNARQAASLSAQTRDVATAGEQKIQTLIKSIEAISEDSKKIADITSVIDDIAFQTNLLALNASVEAARAGEQGKGFAVVAEAVRNLAQRSAESAKSISALISSSVERIEKGARQASESGEVLAEIVHSAKKVSDLNGEISTASAEQSNGIVQIGKAMNQLDQVTQENASASEESAAASEELSSQSANLKNTVHSLSVIIGVSEPVAETEAIPHVKSVSSAAPALKTFKPKNSAKSLASELIPFEDPGTRTVGTLKGF
ncbi:hypothetical protein AZI86_05700 [Bdellovibrio bacteriovorus]|uniref:Methyl-accepting transducer domain-containing protein n=1 Tax=Bdellovibrio bacteriovorus TaxID=959 RepID=A0A150WQ71_BDEBC|nr:methyl-accepting chemotaxis protein [Bdellovibrio bacteriovorus]KYG66538.1 hypothetical protein AZI86_05700 [Bdellovibrio bacteriovorus]